MNTAKRKFNALLQGIGARPFTPQTSELEGRTSVSKDRPSTSSSMPDSRDMKSGIPSSAISESLSKRRRTGVLEKTTGKEQSGATDISNVVLKKWTPNGKATAAAKETKVISPPKYCPSDRGELIERLGTFQELTQWTPKPDKVNEIEWAKRGWTCHGKERVRCTLCHKELVVKTSKKEADGKEVSITVGSDVEEALANKFAELITGAHQEDCLWRKRGCDDTLLRLQLAEPTTALASLRERYDDLCTRPTFLPYMFNLRLPANLDLQTVKTQLAPSFFTQPPTAATPSNTTDVALVLALTGWQGLTNPRIGAVPNSATCATCLRRLGLWMFKSKEIDEATGAILVPAPMDHLDPVREHRFFCPWRNAAAQRNPGSRSTDSKTAWEVLAQTLKNSAFLRRQAEKSSSQRSVLHRSTASVPVTPSKGGGDDDREGRLLMLGPDMVVDDEEGGGEEEEDAGVRDAKDKERWARLRRVKSLFDTKSGRKLRRTLSRPGTATSRPPTGHSRQNSTVDGGGAAEK